MKPIVKVIAHTKFLGVPSDLLPYDRAKLLDPSNKEVAAQVGRHQVEQAGQDVGTDAERLVECAGRTCYDSYGNGRKSEPYHQHIMDVDHGSVTEHASLTFFLSNISRGLTHELVRHRVGVAISQRSTRYVDESQSEYVHHPLVLAYAREKNQGLGFGVSMHADKEVYRQIVDMLEAWLIEKGTDKFTARKQARGAARGYLGNALMTEMVWTCNIRALKQILKQRANRHADAEIRVLANRLYEEALPYWPTYLGRYQKRDCPDGIGYELFDPTAADERATAAEKELAWLRVAAKTLAVEHTADANLPGRVAGQVFERYPDIKPIDNGDHA